MLFIFYDHIIYHRQFFFSQSSLKLAKATTCYYNTHCFHTKPSLMPLLQLSQSQDPMLRAVKYIIKTKKFCFLGLLVPKLLKTLTLCLVRVKRRGKTRERGKWEGKCYFPPFGSVEKTEGMENRGENKSPGPTKIHLPKLGRKQRREKAPILK